MTDHDDQMDDIASAHLDGLTTPAEAARVRSDPELAARVERLRQVREAVGAPDLQPIDGARRDAAIAAAVRAFEAPAPVTSLQRTGRRATSRRTLAAVGVAAAIALVALVVPFLDRLDSDSADQSRSEEAATALNAAPDDDAAGGGSSDAATASAPAGGADLGAFSELAALQAAVRAAMEQPTAELGDATSSTISSGTTASQGAGACPEVDARLPRAYSAEATLAGQRVLAVVHTAGPPGSSELWVIDPSDCSLVARTSL